MSYISNNTSSPRLALWRISEQTKNSNKQLPVSQSTFNLPQRFSPSRKGNNQSRLFNSSMQKLKLSRLEQYKERSLTPKNDSQHSIRLQENQTKRSQIKMHPRTPKKQQKMPIANLYNRESVFSLNYDQANSLNNEGARNLLQNLDVNRKMIQALKEEFTQFKTSVLDQMNKQTAMVFQFITKIQQTCNKSAKKQPALNYHQLQEKLQNKNSQSINRVLNFQNLIKSADQNQKNIQHIQHQLFTKTSNPEIKLHENLKQQSPSYKVIDEIKQHQYPIQNNSEQVIQIHFQQQSKDIEHSKKSIQSSPHIQKCNQIVETINTLNQINASPISPIKTVSYPPKTSRSTEKMMIEEYKQKILAITKSNDGLIKQKTRQSQLRNEQQTKVKGNFKLQKFYSAIQKLKEEVNQIKSINQMKDAKKGKY